MRVETPKVKVALLANANSRKNSKPYAKSLRKGIVLKFSKLLICIIRHRHIKCWQISYLMKISFAKDCRLKFVMFKL